MFESHFGLNICYITMVEHRNQETLRNDWMDHSFERVGRGARVGSRNFHVTRCVRATLNYRRQTIHSVTLWYYHFLIGKKIYDDR